jgi:hypothetical protein
VDFQLTVATVQLVPSELASLVAEASVQAATLEVVLVGHSVTVPSLNTVGRVDFQLTVAIGPLVPSVLASLLAQASAPAATAETVVSSLGHPDADLRREESEVNLASSSPG